MGDGGNQGINMRNSKIVGSVVAGGPFSQAVNQAGRSLAEQGMDELAERLRNLEQALATDGDKLGKSSKAVQEQAEGLAQALQGKPPLKSVVLRLAKGIAEDARAVATIVDAAHALADAVGRLL